MASSQKDSSPNMGKKANGKEIKEGAKSAGKPAFNDKAPTGYWPKGGTGFGTRTLLRWPSLMTVPVAGQ